MTTSPKASVINTAAVLAFVTTVHRPGLPDIDLGFRFQHQAESAGRSLTADLGNTSHLDGTTITWSKTPAGVDPLPPLPTGSYALADLIMQEDYQGSGREFPDLYSRLCAQEGPTDADKIWQGACWAVAITETENDQLGDNTTRGDDLR